MTIKDFFIFFRWKNLLMIIIIQYLLKYILFQKFDVTTSLDTLHFFILVFSTVLIATAGYIINDINDISADKVNKPDKVFVGKKISINKSYNLYLALNFIGLLLGFYLSYSIGYVSFFTIFIITSLLLYRYAIDLKKRFLIGNLTISFVVFLSVFIVSIYDIVPVSNAYNNQIQIQVFLLVFIISCFAFFLTLIREIIKDLEDVNGDLKIGAKTLPIKLGQNKTKNILFYLSFIPLIAIIYFAFALYISNLLATIYLLIFVATPLLYFIVKVKKSITKNDFHNLSNILKIIMMLGILTVLFLG